MKNLGNIRKSKGISQHALAVKAGVTVTTISRLEHGHNDSRTNTAFRIARALDVSVESLLDAQTLRKKALPEKGE